MSARFSGQPKHAPAHSKASEMTESTRPELSLPDSAFSLDDLEQTPVKLPFLKERCQWTEDLWEKIRDELSQPVRKSKHSSQAPSRHENKPTRQLLLEMISILDGMERLVGLAEKEVLQQNPVLLNWLTSIRGLQRRMSKSLAKLDVNPVASLGRRFDVHLHEAIEVRKDPAFPPATVIEVKEKPYRWGDKVLRVGKVIVTPKGPGS